ncbi:hypothetical protein EJ07DRAFT_153906 [Lizonia empirigonia]|nr:hypothetical protein EJ07DRAFT_153906 [Lizonia empirigonia]
MATALDLALALQPVSRCRHAPAIVGETAPAAPSPATWAVIDRLHLQATTAGQVNPTRQNSEHACDFTSQTLGHRHWWDQCLPITAVREIFGMPKPQPYPVLLKSNCAPPRLLSTSADSVCIMVSLKQHAACKNRAAGLDVSATIHQHLAITQQVLASVTREGTTPKQDFSKRTLRMPI